MDHICVSIAINPRDTSTVLVKLEKVSKTLGYEENFDSVKQDTLCRIHQNTNEKTFGLNDFKLVHIDFSVYSGIEFDLHISQDVKWGEIHNVILNNIRQFDIDFFKYGNNKQGTNNLQGVKLGFNELQPFTYWNTPWLTFNDNDRITITHTKRNQCWKKLMCVYK